MPKPKYITLTTEDVDHLDDAICELRRLTKAISFPGLEHIRNKIARHFEIEQREEGSISYEEMYGKEEEEK